MRLNQNRDTNKASMTNADPISEGTTSVGKRPFNISILRLYDHD